MPSIQLTLSVKVFYVPNSQTAALTIMEGAAFAGPFPCAVSGPHADGFYALTASFPETLGITPGNVVVQTGNWLLPQTDLLTFVPESGVPPTAGVLVLQVNALDTPAVPVDYTPVTEDFNPWVYPGEREVGPAAPTGASFPYLDNYIFTSTPGWPVIAAAFSNSLDPSCLVDPNCFSVWKSSMSTYRGKHQVTGTWEIALPNALDRLDDPEGQGSAVIFTPSEPIIRNHRYVIHLGKYIKNIDGSYLGETTLTHFMSKLEPFFIDPYNLRVRLGEFSDKVGDEPLYFEIWRASMRCNRETMPFVPIAYIGGPTAEQVAASTYLDLYAIQMFVELEACEQILRKLITQTVDKINRRHQGLDFQTEIDDGLLKNLQLAITLTHQEREPYYAEISRKRPRMMNTQKSQNHPRWATHDASFPGRKRF